MFYQPRTIHEITHLIDSTLHALVKLKSEVNNNNEALNYCLVDSVGTHEIQKSLKEIGDLLNDPTLETKYTYFLKRAEERINSFNDSTTHYGELLQHTENLTVLIDQLNQDMGLQNVSQTPVSSLVDKICSFFELFYCYWTEDLYKHYQKFEQLFCNLSLHKSTNSYGQWFYTDPTVQLVYLSFIHTRIMVQESYLFGFMYHHYIGVLPNHMPVPWDNRLYDIYGMIKPEWCI